MADYTIASSVNIEKGKQNEEYCVEQVISFQQQTNMEKVFDEVGGGGCIFIIIDILIFRVSKTL
jgi:hypothetical protein